MKIKNKYKIIYAPVCMALLFSCATVKSEHISSESVKSNAQKESEVLIKEEVPSAVDIYKKKVEGVKLTSVSSPKETVKNKAFASPFVVSVTDGEDKALSGFEVTVMYPVSKEGDKVTFEKQSLVSDSEGKVSFTSPVPVQSFNSSVIFAPAFDEKDELIYELSMLHSVALPYMVKTNLVWNGSICLVDFDQKGKPLTSSSQSSSNLLKQLMMLGFSGIGNADFTSQVLNGDSNTVYKAAKNLMGNSSSFLIYGTVKYDSPVQKSENLYKCDLTAEITCISMKSGSILYTTEQKVSVTDKSDWSAVNSAKTEIAKQIALSVKYGM